MSLPGFGESVGSAYVRMRVDGSSLPQDIKDDFKKTEPDMKEAGSRHSKAYREGFKEDQKENLGKDLTQQLNAQKGRLDKTADELGGDFGSKMREALSKALGGSGKNAGSDEIADRIFTNLANESKKRGDLELFESKTLASRLGALRAQAIQDIQADEARLAVIRSKAAEEARKVSDRAFSDAQNADAKLKKERDKADQDTRDAASRFSNDIAKIFGNGSRNNLLNAFGGLVGGATGLIPKFLGTVTIAARGLGNEIKDVTEDVDGLLKKLAAGAGVIGGKLLDSVGALSAGILVLPVLLKVGLGALQVFLGPVAALITDLAGAIVALASTIGIGLVGAVGALLPLLVPLIFSLGAVGLAVYGISQASAKTKKQLLADIAPLKKEFNSLATAVEKAFLGKNNTNVKQLAKDLAPVIKLVQPLLTASAGGIAKFAIGFSKALGSPESKAFFSAFAKFTPAAIGKLGDAFTHTFLGIGGLLRNLIPFANELLNAIDGGAKRFDAFTNSTSGQSRLTKFFTGAVDSAKLLWTFLKDAGKVLGDLLSGGKSTGDALFGSINGSLEKFDAFLNSPRGQKALQGFFAQTVTFLGALGKLVGGFGQLFGALNNGQSQNILNTILTGLGGLLSLIAKNLPTVIPILKDFATGMGIVFSTLVTVAKFVAAHEDIFRPIIISLGALYLAARLGGSSGAFGAIAKSITLGITQLQVAMTSGVSSILTGKQKLQGALGGLAILGAGQAIGQQVRGGAGDAINIASGALGAAVIGASFGGVGAAVGAALGGAVGVIDSFWEHSTDAAKKSAAEQEAALQRITNAAQTLTGAINATGTAYGDAAKAATIAALQKPVKGAGTLSDVAAAQQALGVTPKDITNAIGGDQKELAAIQSSIKSFVTSRQSAVKLLAKTINDDQSMISQLQAQRTNAAPDQQATLNAQIAAAQAKLTSDQSNFTNLSAGTNAYTAALTDLSKQLPAYSAGLKTDIVDADQTATTSTAGLNLATRDLATQILAYGVTLDTSTVAGQRNVQFFKDHTAAVDANVVAVSKTKAGAEGASRAFLAQAGALVQAATAAGFNKQQIEDLLINGYKKLPPAVLTKITADAKQASPVVSGLVNDLNRLSKGVVIPVSLQLKQSQVQNIQSQIADLKSELTTSFTPGNFTNSPASQLPNIRATDPSIRAFSGFNGGLTPAPTPVGGSSTPVSLIQINEGGALFSTPTTDPGAVVSELLARTAVKVGS